MFHSVKKRLFYPNIKIGIFSWFVNRKRIFKNFNFRRGLSGKGTMPRQPIRKLGSVPAARDVIRLPKIIVAGRVIPLDIYNLNYVIDISVIILLIYGLNCY